MKNNYKGLINIDVTIRQDTQDFLEAILDKDPENRINSKQVLEHQIFLMTEEEDEVLSIPMNHLSSLSTLTKTMNEVTGGVQIEGRHKSISKIDSQWIKSGLFNFQPSNLSKGDFSIASVLLGGSQVFSIMSKSLTEFDSKKNTKNNSKAPPPYKKKIVRKFSRFKTQGNTVKLSNESIDEGNSSKDSYLLEDENVSDGEHDNPARILIGMYQ